MKIDTVILSTDLNNDYFSFVDLTLDAWLKLGVKIDLSIVGNIDITLAAEVSKKCDNIRLFPDKIDNVESGPQAKVARLWAAQDRTDNVMIADIDMIPLNNAQLGFYNDIADDRFVKFGTEHPAYQKYPDIGKWAMHGTAGNGKTFKEIVNPNNLFYRELMSKWANIRCKDYRAVLSNAPEHFSDESLMLELHRAWPNKHRTAIARRDSVPGFQASENNGYVTYGRVCRSKHDNFEKVNFDRYFEVHGPRPMDREVYKPVIDYLGV